MIRRTLPVSRPQGLHVAIIMDGNGRWATARGLPRIAGHRAGADAIRRVVEATPDLSIGILTLYAFSSDNWSRPPREVSALMRLFRSYLSAESDKCAEHGIRVDVVGRRDRLHPSVLAAIKSAEERTSEGDKLHLRLAVDYSGRDAILMAARRFTRENKDEESSREEFAALLGEVHNSATPAPNVDLLIRTGGEQRLSDFLLWESAYAEFHFTQRMWPDFGGADLEEAVAEFHSRQRRYGGLPVAAVG